MQLSHANCPFHSLLAPLGLLGKESESESKKFIDPGEIAHVRTAQTDKNSVIYNVNIPKISKTLQKILCIIYIMLYKQNAVVRKRWI